MKSNITKLFTGKSRGKIFPFDDIGSMKKWLKARKLPHDTEDAYKLCWHILTNVTGLQLEIIGAVIMDPGALAWKYPGGNRKTLADLLPENCLPIISAETQMEAFKNSDCGAVVPATGTEYIEQVVGQAKDYGRPFGVKLHTYYNLLPGGAMVDENLVEFNSWYMAEMSKLVLEAGGTPFIEPDLNRNHDGSLSQSLDSHLQIWRSAFNKMQEEGIPIEDIDCKTSIPTPGLRFSGSIRPADSGKAFGHGITDGDRAKFFQNWHVLSGDITPAEFTATYHEAENYTGAGVNLSVCPGRATWGPAVEHGLDENAEPTEKFGKLIDWRCLALGDSSLPETDFQAIISS